MLADTYLLTLIHTGGADVIGTRSPGATDRRSLTELSENAPEQK